MFVKSFSFDARYGSDVKSKHDSKPYHKFVLGNVLFLKRSRISMAWNGKWRKFRSKNMVEDAYWFVLNLFLFEATFCFLGKKKMWGDDVRMNWKTLVRVVGVSWCARSNAVVLENNLFWTWQRKQKYLGETYSRYFELPFLEPIFVSLGSQQNARSIVKLDLTSLLTLCLSLCYLFNQYLFCPWWSHIFMARMARTMARLACTLACWLAY